MPNNKPVKLWNYVRSLEQQNILNLFYSYPYICKRCLQVLYNIDKSPCQCLVYIATGVASLNIKLNKYY